MTFPLKETAERRLLWALALGFFAAILVYRLTIAFSYKQELINGESNNIWNAMNVAHGKPIYSNPEELPLEVFQYTPVSQLPVIVFAKLFNSESKDYLYRISLFGRLTVLFYNLITGYLLFLLLSTIFHVEKFTAFLGALLFFSTLSHPNFSIRPDALLLLVNVALSFGFFTALLHNRNKMLYLMSFLVGFSMLIKQDAFFIMGPVGLFLLFYRKWKELVITSAVFFLGVVFFFALAHGIFGEYFFYSVTKGIQMKSSISQAILVFDRALSLYGFQFIFSLVVAVYLCAFERKNQKLVLLSLFTAVYALLGFASSLKPGSWVNYYTFFILFGSLLSVVFFHRFLNQFRASYFLILAVIITGGVFWFRQIYFYTLPYLKDSGPKADYAAVYNASVKIKNVLELKKGDHVIIANQLLRTFLFEYSVMVNTEYYGLSGFNYDKFRAKNDKEVDYIIASTEEAGIISFLSSTFEIETTSYLPVQEINNFIIYGKEGKLP
jgi:hypothetical protein